MTATEEDLFKSFTFYISRISFILTISTTCSSQLPPHTRQNTMEIMYPMIRIKMRDFRCWGFFAPALIFASFSGIVCPSSSQAWCQDERIFSKTRWIHISIYLSKYGSVSLWLYIYISKGLNSEYIGSHFLHSSQAKATSFSWMVLIIFSLIRFRFESQSIYFQKHQIMQIKLKYTTQCSSTHSASPLLARMVFIKVSASNSVSMTPAHPVWLLVKTQKLFQSL